MEEKPVNKNRTLMIVVIVAVVLLCCCLFVAVAGYYVLNMTRSANSIPGLPDSKLIPPSDVGIGNPPSGSLGNDILINDTWNAVAPAAIGLGCDRPVGADSTIEVIQQPDNGVWIEHWTVACQSGNSYVFEVVYTIDDTGATYNIKPLSP